MKGNGQRAAKNLHKKLLHFVIVNIVDAGV
jgi:hypothetical protein